MRSLLFVLLLASAALALDFINPPKFGANNDFSNNPVYVMGSTQNIVWGSVNQNQLLSLVMYQQRPNDVFEYIFQNNDPRTTYQWTVDTDKDLSDTPVFFFELFYKGDGSPAAISHYFNITRRAGSDDPSSLSRSTVAASMRRSTRPPSSSTLTTSTLSTTSSSSTDPSVTTTPPTSILPSATSTSTSPAATTTSPSSSGLSTGAKAGLGIGIPVAVIGGLIAGWLLFGRRRGRKDAASSPGYYPAPQGSPGQQPVEMAHQPYRPYDEAGRVDAKAAVEQQVGGQGGRGMYEMDQGREVVELPANGR